MRTFFLLFELVVVVLGDQPRRVKRAYEEHKNMWDAPALSPSSLVERSLYDVFSFCAPSDQRLTNDIQFRLYTPWSNPDVAHIVEVGNVASSGPFNGSLPVIMLVHGWRSSATNLAEEDNLLANVIGVKQWNVFFIDWSEIADNLFYPCPAHDILGVGAHVASFIQWLMSEFSMNGSQFYLVGHSLGAQVMGKVGSLVPNISRITGLDPAGPLFDTAEPDDRLNPSDATFVDVIHSCGGPSEDCYAGTALELGDADFYPNGGSQQRECSAVNNIIDACMEATCSHHASITYFSESLTNDSNFLAYQCSDYQSYLVGECFNNSVTNRMGYLASPLYKGKFYLVTPDEPPFSAHQVLTTSVSTQPFSGKIQFQTPSEITQYINCQNLLPANTTLKRVVAMNDVDNSFQIEYFGQPSTITLTYINLQEPNSNEGYGIRGPVDLRSNTFVNISLNAITKIKNNLHENQQS